MTLLAMAFWAVCQEEPAPLKVVSVRRADPKFRVTIGGPSAEKDGTVLQLRVLHRRYRLAGDGRALALASEEVGSVAGLAEVRGKAFTFTFAVMKLHDLEVQISVAGRPVATRAFRLFDADFLRTHHPKELKRFAAHLREMRSFLDRIEPFNEKKLDVPSKLLREMLEVENRIRPWAETTDLAAAATIVTGLLSEMGLRIPFQAADSSEYGEGPYGALPTRPKGGMEIASWREKLRQAEEVAVRETLVLMLGHLADFIRKDNRATVSAISRLCLSPEAGDLAETFKAYGPSAKVADLLARVRAAQEKAEAMDGLIKEIVEMREQIAAGS
ncbi:MAG: hypothetical protein HYY17_03605 [Planctomycetes bacterium]|nr:hypothetical protein [Planctomycetota bacterium]